MNKPATPDAVWADAVLAAALVAVDPAGLGGLWLRARHGAGRQRWLAWLQRLAPGDGPIGRLPAAIDDDRLLGGLDLTATLRTGHPVVQPGLLAQHHGRLLLIPMAERLPAATAARLAAVLDQGTVHLAREGFLLHQPARVGLVALDEGGPDDPPLPPTLADRLALHLTLDEPLPATLPPPPALAEQVGQARARLPTVCHSDADIDALCRTAWALGIGSLRAPWLALQTARAAAAWQGRLQVGADDLAAATRLVLAPRATRWPVAADADDGADGDNCADQAPSPQDDPPPPQAADAPPPDTGATGQPAEPPADPAQASAQAAAPPPASPDERADATSAPAPQAPTAEELTEQLVAAALAALPAGLLGRLAGQGLAQGTDARRPLPAQGGGRSGPTVRGGPHGRLAGSRRGPWRGGARLDLVATLRAAAPHQAWRRAEAAARAAPEAPTPHRLQVRPDDLHLQQRLTHRGSTAVFVVDASGSTAAHRLAEAKGAVELLLADCYVRRDQVALVICRGHAAALLLPPTRSLVRAKRALAGQPGGGGTPLASALDLAGQVAAQVRRQGALPLLVLLTDGRANIARDGRPGRPAAQADALASARRLLGERLPALVVDTAPGGADHRPAAALAQALGAAHLVLPVADARQVADAVRGRLQR